MVLSNLVLVLASPIAALSAEAPESFGACLSSWQVEPITLSSRACNVALPHRHPRVTFQPSLHTGALGGLHFHWTFQLQRTASLDARALGGRFPPGADSAL
jgi:hypothetical protein